MNTKSKRIIYVSICILACTVFAILFHAILPNDANSSSSNSFLVSKIGFKAVATLYFLILYSHVSVSILFFENKTDMNMFELAIRFGLGFGLLYGVGMLEIVPGNEWSMLESCNQFLFIFRPSGKIN